MKAMQLTGIRRMEMREVPDPDPARETDVLIRIGTVGVCGSDIHYYVNGRIGCQIVQYPFTVGHEAAGIVESVGRAVTRLRPGDRIAVEPAMSCGRCDQCIAGRHHTCRELRFLGCPGQSSGCLSEYLVMPEVCCYPIGDDMTLEQATLSEPFAIGLYAVRLSVPMPGARIAILGAGPVGYSVLLAAKALGAERIYVTDRIPARLGYARTAGASWTGDPDGEDVVAGIAGAEPLLLDAVFECCGEEDALDQACMLLKPGGKLMVVGIPRLDRISFPIDDFRRKEICVQNVRRQNHCVRPALDMIADGRAPVHPMVTHRFPLSDTPAAFDLVAAYADGVLKAMIHF